MTTLTLVRRLAARPAIVFAALTEPAAMLQWWGPDAGPVLLAEADVRVGGRWRVRFRMLDGREQESSGEYLAIEPERRVEMSWRWAGADAPDSRVEFALRPIAEGTELTLTHARLRDEEVRARHELGWTGMLDKLVAYATREDRHDGP